MFLKTLTLKGFKSFADTTVLDLEPGVTVVVGPNGSGKSNVVDAIAWVLGAQAPSSVRSQKMDDVIFAGTAKRAALGRAEVTLTLDNSAGLLPLEFSEVSVKRTLFRTGESEYAINGVGCRLLDVQELLSDAGVGRQQHVIVSQGQIDAVLNARPEERRSVIEEAAGVLKFRKRKERAERRLEATEASLLRVQDLLREVRRQLRPLERQAEAARRHDDLVAELSALRLFLAGREIAGHRRRLEVLGRDREGATVQERDLRQMLTRLDTEVIGAEAELTARGDFDIGDELVRVEQLRERTRGLAAVLVERRRSMERDRGQLMDAGVVANLEHDAARVQDELALVSAEIRTLAPRADELAAEEAAFGAERRLALEELDAGGEPAMAASAAAEVRGELRSLLGSLGRAESERERARHRVDQLRDRLGRLGDQVERLRADCGAAETVEAPLVAEVEEAEARRLEAEAELDGATASQRSCAATLARWQARSEALQMALDSARSRAGAERLAGVDGVVGTLMELVVIDEGWEAAVEAALGEALLGVVVRDAAAARRALEHLRSADAAGAVLSLGATTAVAPRHQGVQPAGDAVRKRVSARDARVEGLLDVLLDGAVRVADWREALDVALAHPHTVVVTTEGDRFGAAGWRLAAASGGATAAALEEADEQVLVATEALKACSAEVAEASARVHFATGAADDLHRKLDANDARFTAASESLARVQGDRRELTTEVEVAERSLTDLDDRLERERARIAELELLVPSLEADEAAESAAVRARTELRSELETRAAVLAGRRKDLDVHRAGLHERSQLLEQRLAETERRLAADAEARARAAGQRELIERSVRAVDRLGALVDADRHLIEHRLAALHERRRRLSDEVRAVSARLDQLRRERAAAETSLDEVRERVRRVEIDEAEVRMRLEAAIETLRRDLDTEPDVAMAAELPTLPEGATAPQRVRELERELRLLGPINPLALEEWNELQERHRFLEEQLEDVRTTRRELLRVIRAVDHEIQSVFAAAFADVSANFTDLFTTLFPGGSGRLMLTDPDDLLNTGIEVEAKPGGKNVKKLSLLSGGERSLTALAFLFAVFRSRPSPFYVMDEVEAALDDVNLHRFLGLVAEFCQEAQLLIVSHQKRTMEAADCLLGVTMQPGGSSKVVTERVSAGT